MVLRDQSNIVIPCVVFFLSEGKTSIAYHLTKFASEKSDVDLGVNITGELEGLKKNLDAYKVSQL